MSDETDSAAYDPAEPTPPEREPPRRSTAPQSNSTNGQIAIGLAVLFGGLAIVFGLGIALA
jgi:hypothetical protein